MRSTSLSALVLAAALIPAAAAAQQTPARKAVPTTGAAAPVPIRETERGLAAQARISADSARALALAAVPNGRIAAAEIEREHNRIIYSFELRVPGRSGIAEVNVDAVSGEVLPVEHENDEPETPAPARPAATPTPARPATARPH